MRAVDYAPTWFFPAISYSSSLKDFSNALSNSLPSFPCQFIPIQLPSPHSGETARALVTRNCRWLVLFFPLTLLLSGISHSSSSRKAFLVFLLPDWWPLLSLLPPPYPTFKCRGPEVRSVPSPFLYLYNLHKWSHPSFYLWLNSSHSSSRFAFIKAFSNSTSVFNKQLTFNMFQSQTRFPLSSVPQHYHSPQ